MRRRFGKTALAILFTTASAQAYTGTTGASFLELPMGARATAMGNAYTAIANDAYAALWNPAGIPLAIRPQISATHIEHIEDTASELLAFSVPFKKIHGMGGAIQYFRPGDLIGKDASDNPISSIDGYAMAVSLGYGIRLGDRLSLGLGGKIIRSKIDDVTAKASAMNAGAQYLIGALCRVGLSVDNVGSSIRYINAEDPLPSAVRGGVAFDPFRFLTVSLDGVKKRENPFGFNFGLEGRSAQGFALRAGYSSERRKEMNGAAGLSAGFGAYLSRGEISYAWQSQSSLGSSHIFTFSFYFGKPVYVMESPVTHTDQVDFNQGYEFLKDMDQ